MAVNAVANVRGYFGGVIVEMGEQFSIPDEVWADEKRRPKWARLAGDAVEPVKADADTDAPKRGRKKGGIAEDVKQELFGEPVRAETEIASAAGGVQPDWVAPV